MNSIGEEMGTFVQNSLIKGEQIQETATISWLSQFWYFVMGTILILLANTMEIDVNALAVFFLVLAVVNVVTTELAITNKKLIGKVGFIRRSSIDIPRHQIESLNVDQSIVGRLLGYGKITVNGSGGNKASIPYIKNPLQFRKMVMSALDNNG